MDGARLRVEPYSPEWFKLRQGAFTSSEVWKLMTEPKSKKEPISKTAETYILEKVWEKLAGRDKAGVDNAATQWGIETEPVAKRWYVKLTGNFLNGSVMMFHQEYTNLSSTPDDQVNEDGLLEIKCPWNGANHLQHCFITTDEYFKEHHKEYYWQCVGQMAVFGAKWVDFLSFDPRINSDLGFFCYRLHRNENEINALLDKVNGATQLFNQYYAAFSTGKKEKV